MASYDTRAFGKSGWPAETQLAWPILAARRFSDINRALLLEAGAALNLAKSTAERLLEHLRIRVVPLAEELYVEIEAENTRIVSARPELAATLAGESRCLRAIIHTVIEDMVQRIA